MVPPTQETLISDNPTKKTFILIPFQKGCRSRNRHGNRYIQMVYLSLCIDQLQMSVQYVLSDRHGCRHEMRAYNSAWFAS